MCGGGEEARRNKGKVGGGAEEKVGGREIALRNRLFCSVENLRWQVQYKIVEEEPWSVPTTETAQRLSFLKRKRRPSFATFFSPSLCGRPVRSAGRAWNTGHGTSLRRVWATTVAIATALRRERAGDAGHRQRARSCGRATAVSRECPERERARWATQALHCHHQRFQNATTPIAKKKLSSHHRPL